MSGTYTVCYADPWRTETVATPGPPILWPSSIVEVTRTRTLLQVTAGAVPGLGSADVLVGEMHFLCRDERVLRAVPLWLPPPAPLTTVDVGEMWREIADSGVGIPPSVPVQGGALPSRLARSNTLLIELLSHAHAGARNLLAAWPQVEAEVRRRRPLELPGGREDLVETDREAGRRPGVENRAGRRLPAQTVRRYRIDAPWKSRQLHASATLLAARLTEAAGPAATESGGKADVEWNALVAPFRAVAGAARPVSGAPDPPLSAWPHDSRACLVAVLAALSALEATARDTQPPRAPLCHLWRLYEAWVAVRAATHIGALPGLSELGARHTGPGYEWAASWAHASGRRVTLLTQPQITAQPQDFGGLLPCGLFSVSCDLRPDVLLAVVSPGGDPHLVVVDAKLRGAGPIQPRDAAEAGSKYVWGLRLDASSALPVRRAVIVTTAGPSAMHAAESRIDVVRAVPSRPTDALALALSRALS